MKSNELVAQIAWQFIYIRRADLSHREYAIALKLIDAGILRVGADDKIEPVDAGKMMALLSK